MKDLPFRLRDLPLSARLALTLLVLVNLAGFIASGLHMMRHHENRDEREGLSMTDLQGAYSGVQNPASLLLALEAQHPDELQNTSLEPASRSLLLSWLRGDRISEGYDDIDLGDQAPAEILDQSCLSCHSRNAEPDVQALPFLNFWDDVSAVAFSRNISPVDEDILLASTHTHAISLATVTIIIAGLMLLTSWHPSLRNGLGLVAGIGLFFDLAAWWLARDMAAMVYAIVAGGMLYAGSMVLMMLAIITDLWRPRRSAA